MPTYDFRCEECGTTFEAQASPGGTAPCSACGAERVTRLWSAPAVHKGFGLRGEARKRSEAMRAEREAKRRERSG